MKVNEFPDSSLQFLCAHSALPTTGEMFPDPLYAASRQLAVRRKN
jgi:hypothetical protein